MLTPTATILGSQPPPSAYLESYRVLRSSLMALNEREPFTTALITSARDREGKTTITTNLGTVLGLAGQRTLLVDADFYGAGLTRTFDIPDDTPGFTDVCQGEADLHDAILTTEVDTLSVLPVGTARDMGPELVAATSIGNTIDMLGDAADYVFIDCTPMSGFGTATSLAPVVDLVLMVTVARSDAMVVRRCIDDLEDQQARFGGVIVNDVLPQDSVVHRAFHRYYQ
ncbi:MAG: CpsD/CapB family tyrosine-protein kinase [Armatimonadota bacterium]